MKENKEVRFPSLVVLFHRGSCKQTQGKKAEELGDGAADYDLITEVFLHQCVLAAVGIGPSTDRCMLVGKKCKKTATHSTRPTFSFHSPLIFSVFTVVSPVEWADGELQLLFAATVQERDLGIIIDRSLKSLSQFAAAAKRANNILDISRNGIENKTDISILP